MLTGGRSATRAASFWICAGHVGRRPTFLSQALQLDGREDDGACVRDHPDPPGLQLSRSELAQMVDISAVEAFHTEEDVRNLGGLALESMKECALSAVS